MPPVSPQALARFARLPQRTGEVWQGGLLRMPTWIENGPDGKPFRPWGALWVSSRGLVHQKMEPVPGVRELALALETVLEFGLNTTLAGCRPARIEVRDEDLAAYLTRMLGDAGLAISVHGELVAVKQVLADFGDYLNGGAAPSDAMDAPGVTVEKMRAFASAAKDFYLASPWRHLSDEDLVHVETPAVETGLKHLTVLGAAGHTFGLGFYERPENHEALLLASQPQELLESQDRWALWYGPVTDVPFGDLDLWEEHALPVAGEQAYPVAMRMSADGTMHRPDARILADLEGILLALAGTSEEEIDRGRWTRQVRTHDGPKTVTLCLPPLLEPLEALPQQQRGMPDRRVMERSLAEMERFMAQSEFSSLEEANAAIQSRFVGPMDAMPSTAAAPLEKAQELVYRAFDARGRRKIQLARKALEISPNCADAYVALAEQAVDSEAARDLYARGVAAGERALGPKTFEEDAGHFWGTVKTRPYMRARLGLAQCLEDQGHRDEAIGHYQELLRLNPDDNQGVRDILMPALLETGRDAEAGALLAQFPDDPTAAWKYGWALWAFRREGDSQLARERLREALRTNRHVPKYLTGKAETPDMLPDAYALGSVEEAVLCADELGDAWRATPGAEHWLNASKPKSKRKPQARRRR